MVWTAVTRTNVSRAPITVGVFGFGAGAGRVAGSGAVRVCGEGLGVDVEPAFVFAESFERVEHVVEGFPAVLSLV